MRLIPPGVSMAESRTRKSRRRGVDHRKWWTQGFNAVNVGQQLRIAPYWQANDVAGERTSLIIDPGPAFGLGDHPTTIMALELLELAMQRFGLTSPVKSVLDVGSGVGILSIASIILGASDAVAVDIDPVSVHVAKRNCVTNRVYATADDSPGVVLCVAGVESVSGKFDLVMANLVAPLLLRIIGPLTDNARDLLLLSGIFETMVRDVELAYEAQGFEVVEKRSGGEWRSFLFRRSGLK